MSKSATTESSEKAQTQAIEISLSEFCVRLSESVRRPELLSGFEFSERKAGNLKGTSEAFQARFDKFLKTPV